MIQDQIEHNSGANRVLWISTISFTLLFAVWLQFGVIAIPIRNEFKLNDLQFAWLTAIAILNGALWRLLFGILADRIGGKTIFLLIMSVSALASWLVSIAQTYNDLLLSAFLVGIAGNAFSVGVSWNSAWFAKNKQGFALGLFGAGNVGASVTKLVGPLLIGFVPAVGYFNGWIYGGWRFIPQAYAILLVFMTVILFFGTPFTDKRPGQGRAIKEMLLPLKQIRVWRFSLYYTVVFGAYVALSVWLPKYYMDVYGLSLSKAALLTSLFIFPASLLRPLGGWLSDLWGSRKLMYVVLITMTIASFILSLPFGHIVFYVPNHYDPSGTIEAFQFQYGYIPFTLLIFIIGCAMGIGKAAVFKYIPEYYPKDIGAVGGIVGMLGALGGFILPLLFGWLGISTKIPQTTFGVLFVISLISLVWLHWTVLKILHQGQIKSNSVSIY